MIDRLRGLTARRELVVLGVLLLAGGLLRLWLLARWRPGFVGYPDSGIYIKEARFGPFYDPLRIGGYGMYLAFVRDYIRDDLTMPVVLQHLMGMGSAVLLFATVRRLPVPGWLGLIPAAVLLLSGSVIFLEHAVLTEGLYVFLLCGGLYGLVRAGERGARPSPAVAWALFAGFLLAISVTVRLAGIFLLGVAAVYLVLVAGPTWRRRLLPAGGAVVVMAVILIAFQAWHESRTGTFGFTRAGVYNLYGRVAPWADCTKFTPPKDTAMLCDPRPVEERPAHDVYIFAGSPLTAAFGTPEGPPPPGATEKIGAFSRAAILNQPFDYLYAVGRELGRVIDPDITSRPGGRRDGEGMGPDEFAAKLIDTSNDPNVQPNIAAQYSTFGSLHRPIDALQGYERATRPRPLIMAVLIALAIVAPFAVGRGARAGAALLSATALVMLVSPVVTNVYDWRYVVPAFGPLAAAAALGGWACAVRARAALRPSAH